MFSVTRSCCVFVSAGAVHPAGSVPRCGGSRDGREAQHPLVGRLANFGSRPAQPGRGGPGESVRTRKEKQDEGILSRTEVEKRNKSCSHFKKYRQPDQKIHVSPQGTKLVFMYESFVFLQLFVPSSESHPDAWNSLGQPRTCQGMCLWGTGRSSHSGRDRDELWHVFRANDLSSWHNTQQKRSVES